jgi:hypothetical protein
MQRFVLTMAAGSKYSGETTSYVNIQNKGSSKRLQAKMFQRDTVVGKFNVGMRML